MKTIFKYPFPRGSRIVLLMPKEAEILSLQIQESTLVPTIWALVESANPDEERVFDVYWTGERLPENPGKFINTFQMVDGLVYHMFEKISP